MIAMQVILLIISLLYGCKVQHNSCADYYTNYCKYLHFCGLLYKTDALYIPTEAVFCFH